MSDKTKGVPAGFHTATPYLIIKDAAGAMEFYKKAFDAVEMERITDDEGKVRHGEIKIGDSPIMITDESPDFPEWLSPQSRGGTPVHFYLYVEDCDGLFKQALDAGATQLLPMKDQFYGDRSGGVTDPYGHVWYIATRIENVAEAEIQRRASEQAGS
jgi:PhnB protein